MYARVNGLGSNYYYETIRVIIPEAGPWTFACDSVYDTLISIHFDSFNASNPTAHYFALSDDVGGSDWRCKFILNADNMYTLDMVLSTYDQQTTGLFSITASGPSLATLTPLTIVINPTTTTSTTTTTTTTTTEVTSNMTPAGD